MQVTVSVTESRLSYYDMASPQEGVGEASLRDIESVEEVEQVIVTTEPINTTRFVTTQLILFNLSIIHY